MRVVVCTCVATPSITGISFSSLVAGSSAKISAFAPSNSTMLLSYDALLSSTMSVILSTAEYATNYTFSLSFVPNNASTFTWQLLEAELPSTAGTYHISYEWLGEGDELSSMSSWSVTLANASVPCTVAPSVALNGYVYADESVTFGLASGVFASASNQLDSASSGSRFEVSGLILNSSSSFECDASTFNANIASTATVFNVSATSASAISGSSSALPVTAGSYFLCAAYVFYFSDVDLSNGSVFVNSSTVYLPVTIALGGASPLPQLFVYGEFACFLWWFTMDRIECLRVFESV